MILITGATGNVGREALRLLVARGHKVRAVTRDAAAAALPDDVDVVEADLTATDPGPLAGLYDGVDAVLVNPTAVHDDPASLLAGIASATPVPGSARAVVLSALTVEYGLGEPRFAERFRAVEDCARASRLTWTILRSADYVTNARLWAPQVRAGDIVGGAYGDAATAPVHPRDVAAVAVEALVDRDGLHAGRTHVLTGPQSLTQRDKLDQLGTVLGRELRWEERPPDELRAGLVALGVPEEVPARLLGYLADARRRPYPVSATVEAILGRPALTFADWVAEHAAEMGA